MLLFIRSLPKSVNANARVILTVLRRFRSGSSLSPVKNEGYPNHVRVLEWANGNSNKLPGKCLGLNLFEKSGRILSCQYFLSINRLFSNSSHKLCQSKDLNEQSIQSVEAGESSGGIMKVLGVAEKNDASKRIAGLLSNGTAQTRNGYSVYNKLYQFQSFFQNQRCDMTMTSVSGHLLNCEFDQNFRKWYSCDPVELFDAPVIKECQENMKEIKRTLEQQAVYNQILIIWTDCDREGENIGYEVIDVCKRANPRLQVYRAKFSEITKQAIENAMRNLIQPDKRVSDAVNVRQELDLRIGAAFTRFQTLRLTKKFAGLADRLISYGSCQFPTLGFVVERYKAIQDFVSEPFWKIEVTHTKDSLRVLFSWQRVRLFDQLAVQTLYEACLDDPMARVIKVQSKPKSKWRPVALDTIEFEKLASRKLRISAKEAMKIAEKLYTSGFISYPRTETNIFPPSLNLAQLVEQQTASPQWGNFAARTLEEGVNPRNGRKSDQAHPPIHPTKFHDMQGLSANERKVYELIVRHFLACCSKDAKGQETIVEIEIAEEKFITSGLNVLERNYLEVYVYDKWSDKELPHFDDGETFRPDSIEMNEGRTAPPNLLTEADLIALMEKHGIGTDATHAEHIETIKSRQYVGLEGIYFIPGKLGMGLVEGYDDMGFEMSKPYLRAQLELDLQKICEGRRNPNEVLAEQIQKYKEVFIQARDRVERLDAAMARLLADVGGQAPRPPQGPPPSRAQGPNRRGGGGDDDDDNQGGGGGGPPRARAPPTNSNSRINPAASTFNSNSSNFGGPAPAAGGGGVKCTCGLPAINLTVRKEGQNQGRQFYKCDGGTCGFFEWADQPQAQNQVNQNQNRRVDNMPPPPAPPSRQRQAPVASQMSRSIGSSGSDENLDSGIPNCRCNAPAGSYTVRKDGTNKGRKFFGCSIAYGQPDRCDFFQWDNTAPVAPQSMNNGASPSTGGRRGRGAGAGSRGAGSRTANSNPGGPRRPRKCGLCHQQGHTRRNCHLAGGDEEDEEGTDASWS